MRLFGRRETPPSDALAHLPRDERVVSWADLPDGSVVLASPSGLWWPDGDEHRLIAWPHIIKAVWRDGALTVFEADVVDDLLLVDREPVAAELAVPRDLPPVVRKRIEANVVHSAGASGAWRLGAVRCATRPRSGRAPMVGAPRGRHAGRRASARSGRAAARPAGCPTRRRVSSARVRAVRARLEELRTPSPRRPRERGG